MNPIDDEALQAWLDGALDEDADARVAAAVAQDPVLAERAERMRRLRERLRAAFDPVLAEPVPDRLAALLLQAPTAAADGTSVVANDVRGDGAAGTADGDRGPTHAQAASPGFPDAPHAPTASSGSVPRSGPDATGPDVVPLSARGKRSPPLRWRAPVYALAASLAALTVSLWWRPGAGPVRFDEGRLSASGELARGLDTALAGSPVAGAPVAIGLSFRDAQGRICRSFELRGDAPLAGLACRMPGGWELPVLAASATVPGDGLRQAGGTMTPEVQAAVDARLHGDAFDATEERRARQAGWR